MCGVLFMAMPITIVGQSFAQASYLTTTLLLSIRLPYYYPSTTNHHRRPVLRPGVWEKRHLLQHLLYHLFYTYSLTFCLYYFA